MGRLRNLFFFLVGLLCSLEVYSFVVSNPPLAIRDGASSKTSDRNVSIKVNSPREEPFLLSYLRTSAKRFPVSPVKGISFFNPTFINSNRLLNTIRLQISFRELSSVKKETLIEFLTNYVKLVERLNCDYHSEVLNKGVEILNFLTSREGSEVDRILPILMVQEQKIDFVKGFKTTKSDCEQFADNKTSLVKVFSNSKEQLADFFQEQKPSAFGSAWPLENGLVVTNQHVVENASRVYLVKNDSTFAEAKVLFGDSFKDIAILKVDDFRFLPPSLPISHSEYDIGSSVFTIGYPWTSGMGFNTLPQPQLSKGIISAIPDNNMQYQLSMPIQSGNSGGPLFDEKGAVIGIVSAKLNGENPSGDKAEAVGLAIKIEQLTTLLEDFTERPRVPALALEQAGLETIAPKLRDSALLVVIL